MEPETGQASASNALPFRVTLEPRHCQVSGVATAGSVVVCVCGFVAATALFGWRGSVGFLVGLGIVTAILAELAYRPTHVVVGADGVAVRYFPFRSVFVPWPRVATIKLVAGTALEIERMGGRRFVVAGMPRVVQELATTLRRAKADAGQRDTREWPSGTERGDATVRTWAQRLISVVRGKGYRDTGLTVDQLIDTAENPDEPPETRKAAAFAVAELGTDDCRARVRIAADLCADEELQVALIRAAKR